MPTLVQQTKFPCDPLQQTIGTAIDLEYRRRTVDGILESYHGTYDVLAEGAQNAVDAVEDAKLAGLSGPYYIEITVNLSKNWIGVLDTGIGMTPQEVTSAFAPHVSFKHLSPRRDKKSLYRGYKGVGMTFLAYGTDDIALHSKRDGALIKARMQYGRAWAKGERPESALMTEDQGESPLEHQKRGTYVQIQFSQHTRPRSLSRVATSLVAWKTILRTKTAIGQVVKCYWVVRALSL